MTIKEKLAKRQETLISRRDELMASIIAEEDAETRAAMGETLKALKADIDEVEGMLADIDEPADEGATEGRKFSAVATMQTRTAVKANEGTASVEYRKAFQKFMATGKMEHRADENTQTDDTNISTVIPENLVNKILEKYEQLGTIYNMVTKTAFAVGQAIPVDGIKPVATWVGRNAGTPASSTSGEGATSDAQKKTLGALITFNHFKLRCEIRFTEEVAVMTLPAFEELFVRQVGEAMLRAQEYSIVEGDGYGMPTGILANTPDEGKAITHSGDITYKTLCEVEAAIPANKENGSKWCMTKKQFMAIMGMMDNNKQPVARVNYGLNGKHERTLLGREVVIYEPQVGSKLGSEIEAFIFDFSDYVLNTNYDLGISHARDWDNEDHKTKAVLACDGKVIDKTSLVTLAQA